MLKKLSPYLNVQKMKTIFIYIFYRSFGCLGVCCCITNYFYFEAIICKCSLIGRVMIFLAVYGMNNDARQKTVVTLELPTPATLWLTTTFRWGPWCYNRENPGKPEAVPNDVSKCDLGYIAEQVVGVYRIN